MIKNTGIPYETLTQNIFNQIVNHHAVKTIDVQHDVVLQGKTTKHQIDVYWEFEVGGIKYYTIVQTKDWSNTVEQGELLKFKAIMDDLPNQPRGIFVTRTGYQIGSKEVALKNGIILYELRSPTKEDYKGRIHTIIVQMIAYVPSSSGVEFIFDTDWVSQERARLQIPENELESIQIAGLDEEIKLENDNNEIVGTIHSIVSSFFPKGFNEIPPTKKKIEFEQPTYVFTGNDRFPRMKVKGIEATISVTKAVNEVKICADDFVGLVLRNVLEGTQFTFDKGLKRIN